MNLEPWAPRFLCVQSEQPISLCSFWLFWGLFFLTAEIQKAATTHATHRSQRQRTDPRRTEMIRSVNASRSTNTPSIRTNSHGKTHFRGKLRPKLSHQTKASWTLRARRASLTERRLHISSATLYSDRPDYRPPIANAHPLNRRGEDGPTLIALLEPGGAGHAAGAARPRRGSGCVPKPKCGPDPFYRTHTCIYTCIYAHICRPDHPINQPTNRPTDPCRPPPQPPQNHAQPTSSTASSPTIPRPRTRWACGTTRR